MSHTVWRARVPVPRRTAGTHAGGPGPLRSGPGPRAVRRRWLLQAEAGGEAVQLGPQGRRQGVAELLEPLADLRREIGFAVQREMARGFKGDAREMRSAAVRFAERLLKTNTDSFSEIEKKIFSDFAVILLLIRDVEEWKQQEKQMLLQIIQTKAGADEGKYLGLMQKHAKFRRAVIALGS